ncbi:hypothetical protein JCM19235_1272 [Vibrio maritimus]|uniref:Peptidase M15A C-terminal domain-containing protein n=1 Tax=Vibrio maritimus TaxID=990268 RepID=A0A090S611_9VIBR|nr:hypothetical protein JCM19235_1272 [Vibrio maritimus]
MARLQRVRDRFFAITKRGLSLSSAYRCLKHPDEQAKVKRYGKDYKGGTHVRGTGYDVRIGWGWERQLLIKIAMEEGFLGFGYADSFLHLDDDAKRNDKMTSWTY